MTHFSAGTAFRLAWLAFISSVLLSGSGPVSAHELRPAIGDLRVGNGVADLILRINLDAFHANIDLDDTHNAQTAERHDAPPRLAMWPPHADDLADTASVDDGGGPTWAGAVGLRQQGDTALFTGRRGGGETSPGSRKGGGKGQSGWQVFGSYIPVGFDHILPKGLDHILFVLGLFFLSTHLGPLLWQVSAFTLAHTVTLALGAVGLVAIPKEIVEPLIAVSIVYVAVENIFFSGLSRWRPLIVFGFGLLHGLGFAAVLAEFGLPQDQFFPALIGFNLGVELGQLTVISMAAVVLWLAVKSVRKAPLTAEETALRSYDVMFRAVSVTGSLLIAVIGIYWVIERVFRVTPFS